MSTTLLKTKLYIPPIRSELVSRPQLIKRLDEGFRSACRLSLVSAPAGYGKTTLLSTWSVGCGFPVAWLSLEQSDNDPARFLTYFIAALQTVEECIGQGILSALQSPQAPTMEELSAMLINQIDNVPERFALILDDYHVITSQSIHSVLTLLLEHMPPRFRLVIATRVDPPLPVSRLRGRGQLVELRQSELRFSQEEIKVFLQQTMGLTLSEGDVASLSSRTEGWIAALQMVALSMRGESDVPRLVATLSGGREYIVDYLVDEVLNQQSEDIRAFLLQTSILDRLTGSLCDAITGRNDSRRVLAGLRKSNLLTSSLDDERRWYRYHSLFADLLRRRLQQECPELVSQLYCQASQWCEHHAHSLDRHWGKSESLTMAIDYALIGRDLQRAAHLIGEQADAMLLRGEHATLSRWLSVLPDEMVRSDLRLCVFRAAALFSGGQLDMARLCLQVAERQLGAVASTEMAVEDLDQTQDAESARLCGIAAAIHAYSAFLDGDAPSAIRFSRQTIQTLPRQDTPWRSLASISLGNSLVLTGDLIAAIRVYQDALGASRAGGHTFLALISSLRLASGLRNVGRLHEAAEICQQGVEMADEGGLAKTARVGGLLSIWGDVLCEWNELDQAYDKVTQSCELCSQQGHQVLRASACAILLRVAYARHDWDVAQQAIQELEDLVLAPSMPVWIGSWLAAWKVRTCMVRGRWQAAAQLLEERGLNVDDQPDFLREEEYLALARLLIAGAREQHCEPYLNQTIALLDCLLHAAEAEGRTRTVIEALMLRALALSQRTKERQALAALERVLSLAESEGFVRVFVDEGQPMARLLYEAASRGVAVEYAGRLLAAFSASESLPSSRKTQVGLVEPLSDRELEVVELVAMGLSNREIARRLHIALGTVKNHLQNVYGKLQVHSRTQAVACCREWGLLP